MPSSPFAPLDFQVDPLTLPMHTPTQPAAADHSRFVQRIRRRYAAELSLLPPGLPRRPVLAQLIATLQAGGRTLSCAMRVARQLTLERLAVLDIEQGAPMEDIALVMTELAETTLDLALAQARRDQDKRFGVPRDAAGQRIDFWVVGMGKLGGRELNVSSDIDLVYVYETSGQTEGANGNSGVSAHEYFAQVARSLHALIGEVTEDGFVFRVDLALRPNGDSGPPVVSLAMLEEYLQVQGREWERFAWLKSRVVAPTESVASGRVLPLRSMVTAFVYRRYLDYGVFEGLRQLHRKVREEAQRRAAGRPERANDVKLSRGGIREIEFIVQLLLIVRGGQYPEIRSRNTLRSLDKLMAGGIMKPDTAAQLARAYVFLRQVEHRIQYLDDQQTHLLPTIDADLRWIARSLAKAAASDVGLAKAAASDVGLAKAAASDVGLLKAAAPDVGLGKAVASDAGPSGSAIVDAGGLIRRLGEERELVATEFDALLHDGRSPAVGACRNGTCGVPPSPVDSIAFIERLPPELAARIKPWCDHPKVRALRDESRLRLAKLVLRAVACVDDGKCTMQAAVRFIDWLEPLLRRESYFALLVERPEVQNRLLQLLGLARWPMRYLMLHPGVIDELADERLLHDRFHAADYVAELEARHAGWERSGQADEESLLDTLRRAHHAEVFRTLVRDVEGHITVEQVADDLSCLADATLDCAIRWAWSHFKQRHRDTPRFAVVAYGKLGGKELGYGSDLDVVFLYDDEDERASEVYGAFGRKLINWLTARTAAGELFDIDTALRPNGNSGLLVSSLASFEAYQTGRGGNTAWTWEHQAITRARFCAGDVDLAPSFEAVRRVVLMTPRDRVALRVEVQAMREKVRAARPVRSGLFDVKHSAGGMMDVEFAVQYLVLAYSREHAGLMDDVGNIALLQRAESVGLIAAGLGSAAADAYRDLRRAQHRARLDEHPTQVAPDSMAAQREAVLALWHAVFD